MEFIRTPLAIVDFLAITVNILLLLLDYTVPENSIRVLRTLRMVWLLRLFRFSGPLQRLAGEICQVKNDVFLLFQVWFVLGVFFSSVIFAAEKDIEETDFKCLFQKIFNIHYKTKSYIFLNLN